MISFTQYLIEASTDKGISITKVEEMIKGLGYETKK